MVSRPGMAALLLLAAPVAMSAERTSISGEELAALVRSVGHQASVERDMVGDPTVIGSVGGASYQVLMYGCEGDRCTSMAFTSAFELGDPANMLAAANAWNRDSRFGKVYLDDQGGLTLEMDLDLAGGSSDGQLGNYVGLWTAMLGNVSDGM